MADPQPIDAPVGVDPSVLAAMQGGFVAPAFAPQNQRMYDAPPPMPDASMLPPQVAQAAQTGFAPVPSGVVDGLGAPGSPQYAPPVFQPQPLANPFPALAPTAVAGAAAGAAPSKADVAAAKDTVAAQAADAKAQAKQAAYDATPQGEDDAALKASLGINQDQQAIVAQQGDLEAKAAQAAADKWKQGLADQAALDAKAAADREANLAQQKQMIDQRGKDIEAAAKRVPDPNRFYNSLSTMQHIGVGLMTLLAGAGQGLSRDNGVNPVVKMMTDAQDRDIDAQKAGIEQGNKAIDAKKQLQQDYGHLGDDENAMWQYRKAQSRVMLADQIEATAAQYKAPKALLAAKMAADGLRAEAAKMVGAQADRRLAQQNKDDELKNQRQSIAIAGMNASTAARAQRFDETKTGWEYADKDMARQEAHAAKMEEIQAKKGVVPDNSIAIPTGRLVQPPSGGEPFAERAAPINGNGLPYEIPKESVKEVQDKWAALQSYRDATNKLRELRDASGGHILGSVEGARAALQQQARASLNLHKLGGVQRMSEQSMALADQMMTGSEDPKVVDSYIKSVEPELATSVEDATRDFVYGLPKFSGDPKQFDIPDPLAAKHKAKESDNSKILKTFEESPKVGPFDIKGVSNKQAKIIEDAVKAANVGSGWGDTKTRDEKIRLLESILADPAAKSASKLAAQVGLMNIEGYKPAVKPADDVSDPTQNMPMGMGR